MVYWLLQHTSDVPPADDWLSPAELETQAGFRVAKRRRDWRLGRWTAKRALVLAGALAESEPADLRSISICPDEAGVPCVSIHEQPAAWALSISHSGEFGLAAIANGTTALGCDIETVGRRGEEFVVDYFTVAERSAVRAAEENERSLITTLIWSAKECALKALGVGLRLDTRQVEVTIERVARTTEWSGFAVTVPEDTFHGWWRVDGRTVLTIAGKEIEWPTCLSSQKSRGEDRQQR